MFTPSKIMSKHGLKAPVNRTKQTQPNANGFKLRTADGITRILISNLFGLNSNVRDE